MLWVYNCADLGSSRGLMYTYTDINIFLKPDEDTLDILDFITTIDI